MNNIPGQNDHFTISTYNVLHPEHAINHQEAEGIGPENVWEKRKVKILNNLREADSDIICLQEISLNNLKTMGKDLAELGYSWKHVAHTEAKNIDGLAILYKKKRFLEKDFTFSSVSSRKHCQIDLEDTVTHNVIRVSNCHLRFKEEEATPQMNKIQEMAEKPAPYPIHASLVVGDFNRGNLKEDSVLQSLIKNKYRLDGSKKPTKAHVKNIQNSQIDMIFAKAMKGTKISPVELTNQETASDHLIRASKITLPSNVQPIIRPILYNHQQPPNTFKALIIEKFQEKLLTNFTYSDQFIRKMCGLLEASFREAEQTTGFVENLKNIFFRDSLEQEPQASAVFRLLSTSIDEASKERSARPSVQATWKNAFSSPTFGEIIARPFKQFWAWLKSFF